MSAVSQVGFAVGNGRPPTKRRWWLSSNLGLIGFIVSEIVRFRCSHFGLASIQYARFSRPFLWVVLEVYSRNDVTYRDYRRNPQKTPPWSETRRLSHKAWKSNSTTSARDREKRTKSQRCHILRTLESSPHPTDLHRTLHTWLHWWRPPSRKDRGWNFQGLRLYKGSNFQFSYWFLHGRLQQCSTNALPVIDSATTGSQAVVTSAARDPRFYVYFFLGLRHPLKAIRWWIGLIGKRCYS